MKTLEQLQMIETQKRLDYLLLEKINTWEFKNKIELEKGEELRGERLNFFLKVCDLAAEGGYIHLINNIHKIKDHKGGLEITWKEKPCSYDKDVAGFIWEKFCNENADCVEHYLLTPVRL